MLVQSQAESGDLRLEQGLLARLAGLQFFLEVPNLIFNHARAKIELCVITKREVVGTARLIAHYLKFMETSFAFGKVCFDFCYGAFLHAVCN